MAAQRLPSGERARVDRVVDGDTVIVDGQRVRLIGIDAPESVKPGSPVDCYGPDASARLHQLLPNRTPVLLEYDVERRDRYDRVLAYVWLPDPPSLVNLVLVQEGYARAYAFPPNTAHRAAFDAAETRAAASERGLWGSCPN